MQKITRRLLAATLAALLATDPLLHAQAETTLWAERKRNQAQKSTQIAWAGGTSSPLSALPSTRASVGRALESTGAARREAPESIKAILSAMPAGAVHVRDIRPGLPGRPPVVIMQDIHLNNEAQSNIAAALTPLFELGATTLAVEGATGDFNFRRLRAFRDREAVRRNAQVFLEERRIGAPAFLGVTASKPIPVTGVDDLPLYERNKAAYRAAQSTRADVATELKRLRTDYEALRSRHFPKELALLDDAAWRRHDNTSSLADHVRLLARFTPPTSAVSGFLKAHAMETSLSFEQVDRERRRFIERLVPRLTDEDLKLLLKDSLEYQTGRLDYAEYYERLRHAGEMKGADLAQTPAFRRYLDYVALADKIDVNKLLSDVEAMEAAALTRFAGTPELSTAIALGRRLRLSTKLSRFEMTYAEWTEYRRGATQGSGEWTDLADKLEKTALAPCRDFYEAAVLRSGAMAERLSGLKNTTILLTGGFHTEDVAHLLRERGVPYAVISPRLTKVDLASATAYLSAFTREKTPLEKLVAGDKLFLLPDTTLAGSPQAAGRATETLMLIRTAHETGAGSTDGTVTVEDSPNGGRDVTVRLPDGTIKARTSSTGASDAETVGGVAIAPQSTDGGVLTFGAFGIAWQAVFNRIEQWRQTPGRLVQNGVAVGIMLMTIVYTVGMSGGLSSEAGMLSFSFYIALALIIPIMAGILVGNGNRFGTKQAGVAAGAVVGFFEGALAGAIAWATPTEYLWITMTVWLLANLVLHVVMGVAVWNPEKNEWDLQYFSLAKDPTLPTYGRRPALRFDWSGGNYAFPGFELDREHHVLRILFITFDLENQLIYLWGRALSGPFTAYFRANVLAMSGFIGFVLAVAGAPVWLTILMPAVVHAVTAIPQERRLQQKMRQSIDQHQDAFLESMDIFASLDPDKPIDRAGAGRVRRALEKIPALSMLRFVNDLSDPNFDEYVLAQYSRPGSVDEAEGFGFKLLNDNLGYNLKNALINIRQRVASQVLADVFGDPETAPVRILNENYKSFSVAYGIAHPSMRGRGLSKLLETNPALRPALDTMDVTVVDPDDEEGMRRLLIAAIGRLVELRMEAEGARSPAISSRLAELRGENKLFAAPFKYPLYCGVSAPHSKKTEGFNGIHEADAECLSAIKIAKPQRDKMRRLERKLLEMKLIDRHGNLANDEMGEAVRDGDYPAFIEAIVHAGYENAVRSEFGSVEALFGELTAYAGAMHLVGRGWPLVLDFNVSRLQTALGRLDDILRECAPFGIFVLNKDTGLYDMEAGVLRAFRKDKSGVRAQIERVIAAQGGAVERHASRIHAMMSEYYDLVQMFDYVTIGVNDEETPAVMRNAEVGSRLLDQLAAWEAGEEVSPAIWGQAAKEARRILSEETRFTKLESKASFTGDPLRGPVSALFIDVLNFSGPIVQSAGRIAQRLSQYRAGNVWNVEALTSNYGREMRHMANDVMTPFGRFVVEMRDRINREIETRAGKEGQKRIFFGGDDLTIIADMNVFYYNGDALIPNQPLIRDLFALAEKYGYGIRVSIANNQPYMKRVNRENTLHPERDHAHVGLAFMLANIDQGVEQAKKFEKEDSDRQYILSMDRHKRWWRMTTEPGSDEQEIADANTTPMQRFAVFLTALFVWSMAWRFTPEGMTRWAYAMEAARNDVLGRRIVENEQGRLSSIRLLSPPENIEALSIWVWPLALFAMAVAPFIRSWQGDRIAASWGWASRVANKPLFSLGFANMIELLLIPGIAILYAHTAPVYIAIILATLMYVLAVILIPLANTLIVLLFFGRRSAIETTGLISQRADKEFLWIFFQRLAVVALITTASILPLTAGLNGFLEVMPVVSTNKLMIAAMMSFTLRILWDALSPDGTRITLPAARYSWPSEFALLKKFLNEDSQFGGGRNGGTIPGLYWFFRQLGESTRRSGFKVNPFGESRIRFFWVPLVEGVFAVAQIILAAALLSSGVPGIEQIALYTAGSLVIQGAFLALHLWQGRRPADEPALKIFWRYPLMVAGLNILAGLPFLADMGLGMWLLVGLALLATSAVVAAHGLWINRAAARADPLFAMSLRFKLREMIADEVQRADLEFISANMADVPDELLVAGILKTDSADDIPRIAAHRLVASALRDPEAAARVPGSAFLSAFHEMTKGWFSMDPEEIEAIFAAVEALNSPGLARVTFTPVERALLLQRVLDIAMAALKSGNLSESRLAPLAEAAAATHPDADTKFVRAVATFLAANHLREQETDSGEKIPHFISIRETITDMNDTLNGSGIYIEQKTNGRVVTGRLPGFRDMAPWTPLPGTRRGAVIVTSNKVAPEDDPEKQIEDSAYLAPDNEVGVVADGISSPAGGEHASRGFVATFVGTLLGNLGLARTGGDVMHTVRTALQRGQLGVRQAALDFYDAGWMLPSSEEQKTRQEIGTVVAGVVPFRERRNDGRTELHAAVFSIGDSRVYRVRRSVVPGMPPSVTLLTQDDSLENGSNVVTNAVNGRNGIKLQSHNLINISVEPGDIFLVASDGFHRNLHRGGWGNAGLAAVIDGTNDMAAAARDLIAMVEGGPVKDDISLVLMRADDTWGAKTVVTPESRVESLINMAVTYERINDTGGVAEHGIYEGLLMRPEGTEPIVITSRGDEVTAANNRAEMALEDGVSTDPPGSIVTHRSGSGITEVTVYDEEGGPAVTIEGPKARLATVSIDARRPVSPRRLTSWERLSNRLRYAILYANPLGMLYFRLGYRESQTESESLKRLYRGLRMAVAFAGAPLTEVALLVLLHGAWFAFLPYDPISITGFMLTYGLFFALTHKGGVYQGASSSPRRMNRHDFLMIFLRGALYAGLLVALAGLGGNADMTIFTAFWPVAAVGLAVATVHGGRNVWAYIKGGVLDMAGADITPEPGRAEWEGRVRTALAAGDIDRNAMTALLTDMPRNDVRVSDLARDPFEDWANFASRTEAVAGTTAGTGRTNLGRSIRRSLTGENGNLVAGTVSGVTAMRTPETRRPDVDVRFLRRPTSADGPGITEQAREALRAQDAADTAAALVLVVDTEAERAELESSLGLLLGMRKAVVMVRGGLTLEGLETGVAEAWKMDVSRARFTFFVPEGLDITGFLGDRALDPARYRFFLLILNAVESVAVEAAIQGGRLSDLDRLSRLIRSQA